jgi:polyisoprenoid-binding protein YceI
MTNSVSRSTTAVPSALAGTSSWQIDPAHSHVEFAVRHLMISTVKGAFGDVRGTVWVDESDGKAVLVDVTIQVASIDTRQEQRDAHLRSPDFFDVARFPTITFRSRTVQGSHRDGQFRLIGDLTIRDVTREVTLDVAAEGRLHDPWGAERAGFSAQGKIDRTDFGLTWNQALETGGVVVSNEVKISVEVELIREAKPAAA